MNRARIELEEGRRKLIKKQAVVQEAAMAYLVSGSEHEHRLGESVLAILNDSKDSDTDSEVDDINTECTNIQDLSFSTMRDHGQFVSIIQVIFSMLLIQ